MATAQELGISAPPGGFQQGGWYSGRQYWGGTFGDPGVINSQSNQVGAGKAVSAEVNAQTSVAAGKPAGANQAYINDGAPVTSTPSTNVPGGGSAQEVLNGYQAGAQSIAATAPTNVSDEQMMATIRDQMTPKDANGNPIVAPTAPDLVKTLQTFQASMGYSDLNTSLTSINAKIATIQSSLEAQTTAEEAKGGTVPLNVIAGRQTEEQRLAQVQLDSLNLQKGVIVDQLNTVSSNISMMMQLTEQNYQNASTQYQQEYDNNAKIYDAFVTAKQNQTTLQLEQQKAAAANFQTVANLITSGNINVSQMTPDQKLNITTMEVQAGLPIGTLENLQMSPKDRLLNVSSYHGQVTAITMGADGQIQTQTFGNETPSTPLQGQQMAEQNLQPQYEQALQTVASQGNNQGHVPPQTWNDALNSWVAAGGSAKTFIDNFKQFTDPNRSDFQQAYGITLAQRGITPSTAGGYYDMSTSN